MSEAPKFRFIANVGNLKIEIAKILKRPPPLGPDELKKLAPLLNKFHDPLLAAQRRVVGLDDSFSCGLTLPTYAISRGHINFDMLQLLYRAGADFGPDGFGKTPHQYLIQRGDTKEAAFVEMLVKQNLRAPKTETEINYGGVNILDFT